MHSSHIQNSVKLVVLHFLRSASFSPYFFFDFEILVLEFSFFFFCSFFHYLCLLHTTKDFFFFQFHYSDFTLKAGCFSTTKLFLFSLKSRVPTKITRHYLHLFPSSADKFELAKAGRGKNIESIKYETKRENSIGDHPLCKLLIFFKIYILRTILQILVYSQHVRFLPSPVLSKLGETLGRPNFLTLLPP